MGFKNSLLHALTDPKIWLSTATGWIFTHLGHYINDIYDIYNTNY